MSNDKDNEVIYQSPNGSLISEEDFHFLSDILKEQCKIYTPSPIQNKPEELSKAAEEWASQFKTGEWFEKLRIEAFKAGAQWQQLKSNQPK